MYTVDAFIVESGIKGQLGWLNSKDLKAYVEKAWPKIKNGLIDKISAYKYWPAHEVVYRVTTAKGSEYWRDLINKINSGDGTWVEWETNSGFHVERNDVNKAMRDLRLYTYMVNFGKGGK